MLDVVGSTPSIERALYDICGRYAVLVCDGEALYVYNDACGTRSVFYNAQRLEVSSHYFLLRESAKDRQERRLYSTNPVPELFWNETRHPDLRMLLPNHRLNLLAGETTRFYPLEANDFKQLSVESILDQIELLWDEQLDRMFDTGEPVVLSMTGGLDSRTLLAMAEGRLEKLASFTYATANSFVNAPGPNPWARALTLDYEIVQKLSRFLPKGHRYIGLAPDSAEDPNNAWVNEHIDTLWRNSTIAHGRRILPGYLNLFDNPLTIHYRGSLMEIGQLWFKNPGEDRDEALSRILLEKTSEGKNDQQETIPFARQKMKELGWDLIHSDYDLTDFFYWENRGSQWYSQVLNETDVAFDSLTPINTRRVLDLFLALDEEKRKSAWAQRELIYRRNPFLLFVDINGPSDLYRRTRDA